jgi:hypothetical protein
VTSLERLGAEIAGAIILIGAFIGWWQLHNHTEQKLGAQKCILSETVVKNVVAADNSGLETAHAAQMTQVVAIYEQKLKDSAGTNASLAQRVHDSAVRQGAVCDPAGAPGPSYPDRGLSESQSATLGRLQSDTAAVLDACDADHAKVILANAAYNDWRDKMVAAAKTEAQK